MKKLRRVLRIEDPEDGTVQYSKVRWENAPDPKPSKSQKAHRRRLHAQHYDGCPPRPLFHSRPDDISAKDRYFLRQEVFEAAGWKCQNCGRKRRRNLTLDHIIPLSKGGGWHRDNLQCLCKKCNTEKGNRMPYEQAA